MTYLIALLATAFDDSTWLADVVENEVAVKKQSTKSVADTVTISKTSPDIAF